MVKVVPINNGINFRDLGGIKTKDNREIRPGMLFRAGAFSDITPSEQQFLANELKLHYVLDYRDEAEIKKHPDKLWPNVAYINVPANPFSEDITASLTSELADDPLKLKKLYPADFMIKLYELLPFNNPAYKKLITLLLDDKPYPLVQHCAVGKDRTGIGVAITLLALGVSEEDVLNDYLLTEQLLANYLQTLLKKYHDELSATEFNNHQQLFAAKKAYLMAAFQEIKKRYQTLDNWLVTEYQLTPDKQKRLRDKYLIAQK